MAASQTPDLKTLDAARQRLWTLSNALQTLKNDLQYRESLPPWPALQDATALANHQLQALAAYLSTPQSAALLASAHAYPTPSFPDNAHQNVAEQLLRKKAEPALDAWCAAGRAAGQAATATATSTSTSTSTSGLRDAADDTAPAPAPATMGVDAAALDELWSWAASAAVAAAARVPWGTDFSVAERAAGVASVRHGLRRELDDGEGGESDDDEDDDEDEDEDEDAMAVDAPVPPAPKRASEAGGLGSAALSIEDLVRFAAAGTMSPALRAAGGAA